VNSELVERRNHLRQAIERDQAQLREAVETVAATVKERTDLGNHMAEHPYKWIAGGFFVGLLVGIATV